MRRDQLELTCAFGVSLAALGLLATVGYEHLRKKRTVPPPASHEDA